jgi:hypothetical protein
VACEPVGHEQQGTGLPEQHERRDYGDDGDDQRREPQPESLHREVRARTQEVAQPEQQRDRDGHEQERHVEAGELADETRHQREGPDAGHPQRDQDRHQQDEQVEDDLADEIQDRDEQEQHEVDAQRDHEPEHAHRRERERLEQRDAREIGHEIPGEGLDEPQ